MLSLIVVETVILCVQILFYFGCELLQHDHKDVRRPVDDRIPFLPGFAFAYLLWFPLIALFPLFLYYVSEKDYAVYQLSILVSIVSSTVIYVLFPTSMERHVPEEGHLRWLIRLIYKCDFKGSNCSPSLHCAQCYLILASACLCGTFNAGALVLILIITAAIVVSTVMIKQHALIDVMTAVPLAVFSYLAGWLIANNMGYETILRALGLA